MEQRNENTLFEGLSCLMGAVIVNTTEHVVSAPMVSYLVTNGSQFKCSENFKYLPVREVIDLLSQRGNKNSMTMSVMAHDSGCFLANEALHCLHRPTKRFEDLCMLDFFQECKIVRSSTPDEVDEADGTFTIDDEEHPGCKKQIIRKRKVPATAQFSHWLFPDAASFGGDIMEMTDYPVPTSVEKYCRAVLVLHHPFRTLEDLTVEGSFHKKFKRLYRKFKVPEPVRDRLANVQMFYNSMRMPAREDPLQFCTKPFKCPNSVVHDDNDSDDDEDGNFFDEIFHLMSQTQQRQPDADDTKKMSWKTFNIAIMTLMEQCCQLLNGRTDMSWNWTKSNN